MTFIAEKWHFLIFLPIFGFEKKGFWAKKAKIYYYIVYISHKLWNLITETSWNGFIFFLEELIVHFLPRIVVL